MKQKSLKGVLRNFSIVSISLIVVGTLVLVWQLNQVEQQINTSISGIIENLGTYDVYTLEEKLKGIHHIVNKLSLFLWVVCGGVSVFFGFGLWWLSGNLTKVMNAFVGRLNQSYDGLESMSAKVSTSSEELSNSTTEQAAALQETASSLQQISAMVTRNTDSAKYAKDLSGNSQLKLSKGQEEISELVDIVHNIEVSNENLVKYIHKSHQEFQDIVDVINEISSKTNVINDIVFQTKLLSFNASVEAARAGEHGKGFSVVAQEVGNLAQMSGKSADEITGLLKQSIDKVQDIIQKTQVKMDALVTEGQENIKEGTEKATHVAESLQEILQSSGEVNERVQEIATASMEQSQGVQEISNAISELDQSTQQNMHISQTNLDYSKHLDHSAKDLYSVIEELKGIFNSRQTVGPVESKEVPLQLEAVEEVEDSTVEYAAQEVEEVKK
jgi:methyl-accepting chemotaxis protein